MLEFVRSAIFSLEPGRYAVRLRLDDTSEGTVAALITPLGSSDHAEVQSLATLRLATDDSHVEFNVIDDLDLMITIVADSESRAADAEVGIERLEGATQGAGHELRTGASQDAAASGDGSVPVHVAHLGDMAAEFATWTCGPNAMNAIEGVVLNCPSEIAGGNIKYRVKAQNGSFSVWALPGTFAGSRGRALPIVEFAMQQDMPAPGAPMLQVHAIFLNQAPISALGPDVVLRGQSGREPLVGLMFSVVAAPVQSPEAAIVSASRQAATPQNSRLAAMDASMLPQARGRLPHIQVVRGSGAKSP